MMTEEEDNERVLKSHAQTVEKQILFLSNREETDQSTAEIVSENTKLANPNFVSRKPQKIV